MKEMNKLETQLRSLKPRRPSPKLEQRLFGQHSVVFNLPRILSVFAPTAACLLLTATMLKQSAATIIRNGDEQNAMIAMGMSNQNYAPYLSSSFQPAANRLDTFEWTNRGYSQSSMRSFTPQKATDLQ